jgi:hypothetical protein
LLLAIWISYWASYLWILCKSFILLVIWLKVAELNNQQEISRFPLPCISKVETIIYYRPSQIWDGMKKCLQITSPKKKPRRQLQNWSGLYYEGLECVDFNIALDNLYWYVFFFFAIIAKFLIVVLYNMSKLLNLILSETTYTTLIIPNIMVSKLRPSWVTKRYSLHNNPLKKISEYKIGFWLIKLSCAISNCSFSFI